MVMAMGRVQLRMNENIFFTCILRKVLPIVAKDSK